MRRNATSTKTTRTISPKRRLALVAGTDVRAQAVLELKDDSIDVLFLKKHEIPVTNIRVAGLAPSVLKARGAENAEMLHELGFDALHLLDHDFMRDAIAAYGASELVRVFLSDSFDAVALADDLAMQSLALTADRLVQECAGSPAEAAAVIKQLGSLDGVDAATLLDSGLRATQLKELGYTGASVEAACKATGRQMAKLGYGR